MKFSIPFIILIMFAGCGKKNSPTIAIHNESAILSSIDKQFLAISRDIELKYNHIVTLKATSIKMNADGILLVLFKMDNIPVEMSLVTGESEEFYEGTVNVSVPIVGRRIPGAPPDDVNGHAVSNEIVTYVVKVIFIP